MIFSLPDPLSLHFHSLKFCEMAAISPGSNCMNVNTIMTNIFSLRSNQTPPAGRGCKTIHATASDCTARLSGIG